MPRSMTGYGVATGSVGGGRLLVEIRTVNHRYFAASLKLPAPLLPFEAALRNRLHQRIDRGQVAATARWLEEPERPGAARVNVQRGRELLEALQQLKAALDIPGEVDLSLLARLPDVLTAPNSEDLAVDGEAFFELVERALDDVIVMRDREGASLAADVRVQLHELSGGVREVELRAPERIRAERERLRRAVSELLDGRPVDEDRIGHEIALLADKLDISEEVVRLRSHVDACSEALLDGGPVGRRLTFLGQELLREVNTIGSKANDATIAQAVIGMKCAVERFREQVENIE